MSGGELRSGRFRTEREADWRRLESLLTRAERGRASRLSDAELLELPQLYRAALSSLSVARATALDASLIAYLEGLATRAYFFVYGTRARLRERLAGFFRRDWPAAVRGLWRETLASAVIFAAAVLVGYVLVIHDPDWYGSIMPGVFAQGGRDPAASTAFLKSILYDTSHNDQLSSFATHLFTNNATVAIMAFALGFAFCIPSVLLVAQQGLILGALVALYVSRGLGFELGGWLMIHGVTELFAIILAGAAGIKIGWAVIFPGGRPRLEAAAASGRTTGAVMAGVVVMLMFAGILEGVGRQTITLDWARWSIAWVSLTLWLGYFYLARERLA